MAKKSKKSVELAEVARITLENGTTIVRYEDGSMEIIPAPIKLTAEEVATVFGTEEAEEEEEEEEEEESDEDEDEDEDEESEEEEEEEEEELTPEQLSEMDFEELEDLCDENDLETDPDEFDEDGVEDLRKAIAKELGIKLPKKESSKKKGKNKK